MKNLTKALVASGLLLSISGCNQEVMDCLKGSSPQVLGIDAGGSPVSTLGIDAGGSPVSTLGIDAGGSPVSTLGIDAGGSPVSTLGIDAGGSPSSYDTSTLDPSVSECLSRIQFDMNIRK